LGIEVIIGTIMVAGGFYLLLYAVPKGLAIECETLFINTVIGILYVGLSALFATYALLG